MLKSAVVGFTLIVMVAACGADEAARRQDAAGTTTTPTVAVATPTTGTVAPTSSDSASEEWCAIEEPRFDFDPSDPTSVEEAFALNLAYAEERAANPPAEIAEATAVMVDEIGRFIDVLESAGWDLDAAESESQFPPEAQAADNAIVDFEVEHCGKPDLRD